MSSLKQFREQMFQIQDDPDGFGRVENITGLAAQSVTAGSLAFGTVSNSKYQNKYIIRPDATTTADRARICSAYTSSSGQFTHAGTAYADTTVGTEVVEISEYEVARLDASVNRALGRLRFRDVEHIPTNGAPYYWLGQFSWVNEPGDVQAVYWVPRPVISRNRFFQKWNIASPGTAAITAVPDWWTAYGASATYQRITTSVYQAGQNAVQIVAPGGNVVGLSQSVGLLNDGVSGDNLASKIVTVVGVAQQSVASNWRVWYSDDGGTTKQYSAYQTNITTPSELTLQVTIAATASNPTVGVEVVASATVQVSQCYMMLGAISDSVRKNTYTPIEIEKQWDQSAGPQAMRLYVPQMYGIGGQIEIHAKRAYPTLTLDTDTADAPLVPIATDALFLLYRGLASTAGQDNTRYKELEAYWLGKASMERAKHYSTNFGGYGAPFPPARITPFPRRVA